VCRGARQHRGDRARSAHRQRGRGRRVSDPQCARAGRSEGVGAGTPLGLHVGRPAAEVQKRCSLTGFSPARPRTRRSSGCCPPLSFSAREARTSCWPASGRCCSKRDFWPWRIGAPPTWRACWRSPPGSSGARSRVDSRRRCWRWCSWI
jgi:hypothetical protein